MSTSVFSVARVHVSRYERDVAAAARAAEDAAQVLASREENLLIAVRMARSAKSRLESNKDGQGWGAGSAAEVRAGAQADLDSAMGNLRHVQASVSDARRVAGIANGAVDALTNLLHAARARVDEAQRHDYDRSSLPPRVRDARDAHDVAAERLLYARAELDAAIKAVEGRTKEMHAETDELGAHEEGAADGGGAGGRPLPPRRTMAAVVQAEQELARAKDAHNAAKEACNTAGLYYEAVAGIDVAKAQARNAVRLPAGARRAPTLAAHGPTREAEDAAAAAAAASLAPGGSGSTTRDQLKALLRASDEVLKAAKATLVTCEQAHKAAPKADRAALAPAVEAARRDVKQAKDELALVTAQLARLNKLEAAASSASKTGKKGTKGGK